MIITKLVGLFASWIDIEKRVRSWMQQKCSRRSAGHMQGARVSICERTWVGLPSLTDKEESHNSRLVSDDQSTVMFCIIDPKLFGLCAQKS